MSIKKRPLSPSRSATPLAPDYTPHSPPLDDAGPSRLSATPFIKEERQAFAKPGTVVSGSGDGSGCGDECFLWGDLPMNNQGFRYVPCSPSVNISPNPLHPFYRALPAAPPSPPVHISWCDRSAFLRLSPDGLTATTDRGFRSARANISVREGSWYYEVEVLRADENSHVRVGWGRREANLDGPVGMDGYGYGIRDVGGEKVHLSRLGVYGRPFRTGDVVGCAITLPTRDEEDIKRKRSIFRYRGQYYFEMDEYTIAREMEALVDREGKLARASETKPSETKVKTKKQKKEPLPVVRPITRLANSRISFYLKGEPLGEAFTELYDFIPSKTGQKDDGTLGYYPMISVFGRGKVKVNFSPTFLPDGHRAMSDRWDQWREEEEKLDERDEAELTIRLAKDMAEEEMRKDSGSLLRGRGKKVGRGRGRKRGGMEGTPLRSTPGTDTPVPVGVVKMEMESVPGSRGESVSVPDFDVTEVNGEDTGKDDVEAIARTELSKEEQGVGGEAMPLGEEMDGEGG